MLSYYQSDVFNFGHKIGKESKFPGILNLLQQERLQLGQ